MDSDEDRFDVESVDEDFYSGVDSDVDVADDDYEFGDNNSDDSDEFLSSRNQVDVCSFLFYFA